MIVETHVLIDYQQSSPILVDLLVSSASNSDVSETRDETDYRIPKLPFLPSREACGGGYHLAISSTIIRFEHVQSFHDS